MGLDPACLKNVGKFTSGQKQFLTFHRSDVFLKTHYKPDQVKKIITLCADQKKLEAMSVKDFIAAWV